jgi:hypothetical protein
VGLVELLNPMMTQSKWLQSQKWFMQTLSFVALYSGAAINVGYWHVGVIMCPGANAKCSTSNGNVTKSE